MQWFLKKNYALIRTQRCATERRLVLQSKGIILSGRIPKEKPIKKNPEGSLIDFDNKHYQVQNTTVVGPYVTGAK